MRSSQHVDLVNEQANLALQRQLVRIHRLNLVIDAIDLLGFNAFFLLQSTKESAKAYQDTWRYLILPLTITMTLLRTVLAWHQARVEKWKRHTVVRAGVESASLPMISTAIIGGFVAEKAFARTAPILFAITLVGKTVLNTGASIYNWGKANAADTTELRRIEYTARKKGHAIGAAILGLAALGVILAMLIATNKPMVLTGISLGAFGSTLGLFYSIYKLCTTRTPDERAGFQMLDDNDDLENQRLNNHHQLEYGSTATIISNPLPPLSSSIPISTNSSDSDHLSDLYNPNSNGANNVGISPPDSYQNNPSNAPPDHSVKSSLSRSSSAFFSLSTPSNSFIDRFMPIQQDSANDGQPMSPIN